MGNVTVNGFDAFKEECVKHGLEARDCGNGHWQAKGAFVVNYYPDTDSRSAYVNGMTKKHTGMTTADVIRLAVNGEGLGVDKKGKRRSREGKANPYTKEREALGALQEHRCLKCGTRFRAGVKCTVDHIIPVSRGGSDQIDNLCLLCEPCNQEKADNIDPELSKKRRELKNDKVSTENAPVESETESAELLESERPTVPVETHFTEEIVKSIAGMKGDGEKIEVTLRPSRHRPKDLTLDPVFESREIRLLFAALREKRDKLLGDHVEAQIVSDNAEIANTAEDLHYISTLYGKLEVVIAEVEASKKRQGHL